MKDTIFNLTDDEILHHHIHVDNARSLIQAQLGLGAEEDGTLSGYYGGFYLIVGFSHLHPLMVFSFCRPFTSKATVNTYRALNRANVNSILGSHSLNLDIGCYCFRATHWLFEDLSSIQLQRFMDRCMADAQKGYCALLSKK